MRKQRKGRRSAIKALTPSEIYILKLLAIGKSGYEIEKELHITKNTLYAHIYGIKNKTGIRNRILLAFYAYGNGYITSDEIKAAIRKERGIT